VEFPIQTTIRTLNIRLTTSLAITCDCLIKWRPTVRAITRTDYQYHQATTRDHHVFYPSFQAITQGMSVTTQWMLQQVSTLKPSSKAFKDNPTLSEDYNPQTQAFTSSIVYLWILQPLMISLRWLLSPQAPTHGPSIYWPPPIDHIRELSNYGLQSVTPSVAPNTDHNPYSSQDYQPHRFRPWRAINWTICISHN